VGPTETCRAAVHESILHNLQEIIDRKRPKAVVGNKGYSRFVTAAEGRGRIDRKAVKANRGLDGTFVLTTNSEMPAAQVAATCKGLWRVERTFHKEPSNPGSAAHLGPPG
jgi:hypothetical protein